MATNITAVQHVIGRSERANMLGVDSKFHGCTVWFTGLSGAGKTTLSFKVEAALTMRGIPCYGLDGDNCRTGLNKNLGFSKQDRNENIRRVAEVSKLFADGGIVALCSFISPTRNAREQARQLHKKDNLKFLLCHVATPLEVCELRDPNGLYKRARRGEIKGFTGIDAVYEEPEAPDIVVGSRGESVEESVDMVLAALEARGIIPPTKKSAAACAGATKRIVVIGGTGHVGSYLCPRLADAGWDVIATSRGEREPYPAAEGAGPAVENPDPRWAKITRLKLDRTADDFRQTIVDLDPHVLVDMICFTLDECRSLVEALHDAAATGHHRNLGLFVHVGSIWAYGPTVAPPTDEDGPHSEPVGSYGRNKLAIAHYLGCGPRHGVALPATIGPVMPKVAWSTTVLHPGHIVGRGWPPLNPQGNFDPRVFASLRDGKPVLLPDLGMATVHHVHADDVASAIVAAAGDPAGCASEAFSVVSKQAVTLRGYAEAITKRLWPDAPPPGPLLTFAPSGSDVFVAALGEASAAQAVEHIRHSPCCTPAKLDERLGFTPAWTSVDAVADAVRWLESADQLGGRGSWPGKPAA